MMRKENKTYGSRRKQSGIFKPRDILRSVPDTSTLFDALYSSNIKQIIKQKRCDLVQPSQLKLKKPLKKRERDDRHVSRVLQLSDSSTDRSLHVKRNNSDPFDKLLESIKGSDAAYCRLLANTGNTFDPKINITPDSSANSLVRESPKDDSFKLHATATAKSSARSVRQKKKKKKKRRVFLSPKTEKANSINDHDLHISKKHIETSQTMQHLNKIILSPNELNILDLTGKSCDSETENIEKSKHSEYFSCKDVKNQLTLPARQFNLSKLSTCFTPKTNKIFVCSTPIEKTDAESNSLPHDSTAIIISDDDNSDNKNVLLTSVSNSPGLSLDYTNINAEIIHKMPSISVPGHDSKYMQGILTKSESDAVQTSSSSPNCLSPQNIILEEANCLKEFYDSRNSTKSLKNWVTSDEESDLLGFTQQIGDNDKIVQSSPDMFGSSDSLTSLSKVKKNKENILSKLALFPKLIESKNINKNKPNQLKSLSFQNNSNLVSPLSNSATLNSSSVETEPSTVFRKNRSLDKSQSHKPEKKGSSYENVERITELKNISTQGLQISINHGQSTFINTSKSGKIYTSEVPAMGELLSASNKCFSSPSESNMSMADQSTEIVHENIYVATRKKTANVTLYSKDESFYDKYNHSNCDITSELGISELHHSPVRITRRQNNEAGIETVDSRKSSFSQRRSLYLQPGKKWARSLSILRTINTGNYTFDDLQETFNETYKNDGKGRKYRESVAILMDRQMTMDKSQCQTTFLENYPDTHQTHRLFSKTIVEEDYIQKDSDSCEATIIRQSIDGILSDTCNDTAVNLSKLSISEVNRNSGVVGACLSTVAESAWSGLDARDVVLRRCNQTYPLPFDECYPKQKLRNCCKIGEGVYGEVFLFKNASDPSNPIVMKIIPIEGKQLVNGDHQKKFEEILSEIVTAMELSGLRSNEVNQTTGFNKVQGVRCVQGRYPERLIELWELYDELKGSENDCPTLFEDDQLYIILELANAGTDLEAYRFTTAAQAYSVLCQVAFSLAVAEAAFQFEHRDLHWGNVLITPTDDKLVDFIVNGIHYDVETFGVKANIIDFTLSRITLPRASLTLFNNLATDTELFDAVGDYQFDIYRLMREKNGNLWQHFEPYTNLLWLHYAVDKMIKALRYEKINTKEHKSFISKLKVLEDNILKYDSCVDFVTNDLYSY